MNNVKTNPANVRVSGGELILTLKNSSEGALVSTNPHDAAKRGFQFTYGYAEARIWFPGSGKSAYDWPTWWTDGQNWPENGEADIAEGVDTLTSNYHSSSGEIASGTIPGVWAGGWHTYGLDREPGVNTIYYDGNVVCRYSTNDGGSRQYLILNVGWSNTAVNVEGSQVLVDYVRVWRH